MKLSKIIVFTLCLSTCSVLFAEDQSKKSEEVIGRSSIEEEAYNAQLEKCKIDNNASVSSSSSVAPATEVKATKGTSK